MNDIAPANTPRFWVQYLLKNINKTIFYFVILIFKYNFES